jgi:predicted amidophosphoribosyltransferase
MPTFKHPCPSCGKYVARDVARCPFCGAIDPFVTARCTTCRAPLEDPDWVACPKCGTPLKEGVAPMPRDTAATTSPDTPPAGDSERARPPAAAPVPPASSVPASAPSCAACAAPLAPGSRFCTVCGTIAG